MTEITTRTNISQVCCCFCGGHYIFEWLSFQTSVLWKWFTHIWACSSNKS